VGRNNNRLAEIENLQVRLQQARWRLRVAAYGGPEWAAATAGLEELEATLDKVRRGRRTPDA
jgi:hypothetical protein